MAVGKKCQLFMLSIGFGVCTLSKRMPLRHAEQEPRPASGCGELPCVRDVAIEKIFHFLFSVFAVYVKTDNADYSAENHSKVPVRVPSEPLIYNGWIVRCFRGPIREGRPFSGPWTACFMFVRHVLVVGRADWQVSGAKFGSGHSHGCFSCCHVVQCFTCRDQNFYVFRHDRSPHFCRVGGLGSGKTLCKRIPTPCDLKIAVGIYI
ncbi:hypothetical protein D3C75_662630 [compost metagenome]